MLAAIRAANEAEESAGNLKECNKICGDTCERSTMATVTMVLAVRELFSTQEAQNLLRYGGLNPQTDFLQFDPALSYGIVEYHRTL